MWCLYVQMLRRSKGALELLDVNGRLPALKRQRGKSHWVVRDKVGYRASYSEVEQVGHSFHWTWLSWFDCKDQLLLNASLVSVSVAMTVDFDGRMHLLQAPPDSHWCV